MPKLGERMPFELTWKQEIGLESVAKPDTANKATAPSKGRRETEVRRRENEKKTSSPESKK